MNIITPTVAHQIQYQRIMTILEMLKEIEQSSLSVNQYFKTQNPPLSRAQYYLYKKALQEVGIEGLIDQRTKGNNLKFTKEMKGYAKGMLTVNRSLTTQEVQQAIKDEFGVPISKTVIKNFRRENELTWRVPKKEEEELTESGAAEIAVAIAMTTGFIDVITDTIEKAIQQRRSSPIFTESMAIQKDHIELRANGKFTAEYNQAPEVRESRFDSIDQKVENKRYPSMRIFSLSKETLKRYSLALFSLPLVTSNGRARSVDNPRGNALEYLCEFNYKSSTLNRFLRELKYLQFSNELIAATAKYWLTFWGERTSSDTIFVCYYIDGNTKALWSSKPCKKGRVTMLGRVMNCLEQVFIHDGQGHPIYFQTFSGHADLGNNALKMMDTISTYLEEQTSVGVHYNLGRILILDGGGNGVKTLRELAGSDYHYITILDPNQVTERKLKSRSEETRYTHGPASLVDCKIELLDSKEKGYIFETRAVEIKWDTGKVSVLVTSLPSSLYPADNVVKSYFDRWPAQELTFKNMKTGVNLHRIVGYGKKLVENTTVLEKIRDFEERIRKLEEELEAPLREIAQIDQALCSKIEEERLLREQSVIKDGKRFLPEQKIERLKDIQKEINKLTRKKKTIETAHARPFRSLKKKRIELMRIIDKKKIYRVDVELDQIMTCFKLSFANVCSYLLDTCFNGERMTLERLFETIFDLRGRARVEDGLRSIFIEKNPKQEGVMEQLSSALEIINTMSIKDLNGRCYRFGLV